VHDWPALARTGAQVIGVDWQVRLSEARRHLPGRLAVQGNLDPLVMTTTPEIVAAEARCILDAMDGAPGHIFNLGHGLPPETSLANLERLVETVRAHRPKSGSSMQPAENRRGAEARRRYAGG
jgi:uroporphyrinogen decarboxylase